MWQSQSSNYETQETNQPPKSGFVTTPTCFTELPQVASPDLRGFLFTGDNNATTIGRYYKSRHSWQVVKMSSKTMNAKPLPQMATCYQCKVIFVLKNNYAMLAIKAGLPMVCDSCRTGNLSGSKR